MSTEVTWKKKAGIGAIGGLCLALLKLVEARFFIDNVLSTESIASYLTYFVYMILGMALAVFLTENGSSHRKIKKNAFILGLLAPSILIAIVTQPIGKYQSIDEGLQNVPKLGGFFIQSAYAESDYFPKQNDNNAVEEEVVVLKKKDIEPSFKDAIWMAVGRAKVTMSYAYVVGSTTDQVKAVQTAKNINMVISASSPATSFQARVIKPEGIKSFYVTIGTLNTPTKALEIKSFAQSAAIKTLTMEPDIDAKLAAELLLKGKVVQVQSFFK